MPRATHHLRGSARRALMALYAVLCALAVTWPGYAWISGQVVDRPLGLPFPLLWHAGWVVLTFVALVVFHLTGRDR